MCLIKCFVTIPEWICISQVPWRHFLALYLPGGEQNTKFLYTVSQVAKSKMAAKMKTFFVAFPGK